MTAFFTSLISSGEATQTGDEQIVSLIDTWLVLRTTEGNGEHNRLLYVRKSRGMAHSNQIREFLLTGQGMELADVYVGPERVLTGSARQAQEARERSEAAARMRELDRRRGDLERRRVAVAAQTAELWREVEAEAEIVAGLRGHGSTGLESGAGQRAEQSRLRRADGDEGGSAGVAADVAAE